MRDPRNPSGEKRIENRVANDPANAQIKMNEGFDLNNDSRVEPPAPADPAQKKEVQSSNEPILMPHQREPFNNDHFVAEEFLKLKEKFNIEVAIELGTCLGGTTKWLGNNFKEVASIEINNDFLGFAKKRCAGIGNISFYLGSTVDRLAEVLGKHVAPPDITQGGEFGTNMLLFIDSHWNTLPIFDELKIIKASGLKPVIAIHDFLVPGEPKLGFDSYEGVDISLPNIKSYIDDIYGVDGYDFHYNTDSTSTDVKRGLIYIYPKN